MIHITELSIQIKLLQINKANTKDSIGKQTRYEKKTIYRRKNKNNDKTEELMLTSKEGNADSER